MPAPCRLPTEQIERTESPSPAFETSYPWNPSGQPYPSNLQVIP
ncbi:hypothetical protein FHS39_000204 [Streptomyces olivoverticillatus]|uniref:Uncharacterized protein n=1 Tax=Streptomyces olivoverticillatus TaxID=66427 RepID=A0A7W7LJ72_9ACTN|nr:hypothetical protein [Streptomyces olivoverticillatus]